MRNVVTFLAWFIGVLGGIIFILSIPKISSSEADHSIFGGLAMIWMFIITLIFGYAVFKNLSKIHELIKQKLPSNKNVISSGILKEDIGYLAFLYKSYPCLITSSPAGFEINYMSGKQLLAETFKLSGKKVLSSNTPKDKLKYLQVYTKNSRFFYFAPIIDHIVFGQKEKAKELLVTLSVN